MGNVPSAEEFFHTGNDSAEYWGAVGNIFTNVADTMLKTAAVILTPVSAAIQASTGNFAGALSTFTSLPSKMITQFEAVGELITDPTKDKKLTWKSELGVIGGIAGVPVFVTNMIYDTLEEAITGSSGKDKLIHTALVAKHIVTAGERTGPQTTRLSDIMSIADPDYKLLRYQLNNTNIGRHTLSLIDSSINQQIIQAKISNNVPITVQQTTL